MRKKVYIETSVVSYLAGRPTSDKVISEHQSVTRRWWEERRQQYGLVTSEAVHYEAGRGNELYAAKRLAYLQGIRVLDVQPEERDWIVQRIMDAGGIPLKAVTDATHVAICAVHGIDYLLTWNCTHLANPPISGKVENVLSQSGYRCPEMLTPEEMVKKEVESE
jgi:predicted nucleic acid-binding protein